MLQGYKTYLTVVVLAIYNIALPLLGITDISTETLDITINTILLISAAIFRKIAKPKVK
ncbi:MAG: hypothetical protein WA066_02945 [Candidatus Omnitrophota bacterium]